jgi:hypothetical protein
MADAAANRGSSVPLNQRLVELLRDPNTNGVFIGELHDAPALRQSLVYLMPQLIANGVTTLSIEVPQHYIDAMISAGSEQAWVNSPEGRTTCGPGEMYNLVMSAHRAGIRVLGHEQPNLYGPTAEPIMAYLRRHFPNEMREIDEHLATVPESRRHTEGRPLARLISRATANPQHRDEIWRIARESGPVGNQGVLRRNEFAADYINENRLPGKVLVLGGAAHSSQLGALRWPDSPSTLQEGLDRRLNLSVINTSYPLDSREPFRIGPGVLPRPIGNTRLVSGIPGAGAPGILGGPTYAVTLPDDLRQFVRDHHITQWPPQVGVPTWPSPPPQALPQIPPLRGPGQRGIGPR